jgi:hypothetical protein
MEVFKPVMLIICLLSGIVYVGITFSAYSKRNDKSFMGGANMLNGWWVVFPYGKDGIGREHKELVTWGRVTIILCMLTGYLAYAIG